MRPCFLTAALALLAIAASSADPSCPAPAPAKATRIPRAVSTTPRIYLIDGFLSNSEIAHVRKLGDEIGAFGVFPDVLRDKDLQRGDPAKTRNTESYHQEFLLPHHYDGILADETVTKLEDRISVYSQVPRDAEMRPKMLVAVRNATQRGLDDVRHGHEPAALTLAELAAEGKKVPLAELQATVIGYLGNVEKGGETIFPCICARSDPLCARAQKACKYLYINGVLSAHSGGHGKPFKEASEETADKLRRAAEFLAERSEALCNDKKQPGLRVSPRAGRTLIIHANNVRGDADPRAWHGSCNVVEGQKVEWQRFLYAPQYDEETGVHGNALFEWDDFEL